MRVKKEILITQIQNKIHASKYDWAMMHQYNTIIIVIKIENI